MFTHASIFGDPANIIVSPFFILDTIPLRYNVYVSATLTDKTKILDRALKLEQLKLKMSDDEWGSGFMEDDDGDT